MTSIERLDDHLYMIDAYMERQPQRLACYLFDGPERVLVEVGPSSTLPHLVEALDDLGVDDLSAILVTHIHLDHAGGAGTLAARFPKARIGVHASGARHLVDPDRLWSSAARIYGHQELLDMWGPIEPVAESRLLVLEEGSKVPLGGSRSIAVLHTPGHARHHVAYYEEDSGGLLVGDSAGVCYPHGHFVMPLTPPPDFDPEEAARQMRRMAALEPHFVGFAHFGPEFDVAAKLAEAEARMLDWVAEVTELVGDQSLDDAQAAERLRAWSRTEYLAEGFSEREVDRYDSTTFWEMHVAGVRRWLAQQPL